MGDVATACRARGLPPRVRADITLDWPTWAQTAYRFWYIGEPIDEPPRIEIEIRLADPAAGRAPERGAACSPRCRDRARRSASARLERFGPTVETLYREPLEDPSVRHRGVATRARYELTEEPLADGSILDDHFCAMGGWIASTLVRLGDLKLDFLPPDEEEVQRVTEPVLLEVSDRIATVTLNRPDARNALSSEVLRLLPSLLREADGRDDVDVIILTGADPAFCAGLDLKELGSSGGNLRRRQRRRQRTAARPARSVPADGASRSSARSTAPPSPAASSSRSTATSCRLGTGPFADTHARVGVMPGWGSRCSCHRPSACAGPRR